MAIHSALGAGFLEAVYCEVLEKELIKNKIPYEREVKLEIYFDGEKLIKTYRADFVCFNEIILEIKSMVFIHDNITKQLRNYLKATNKKLGIIINFGEPSLRYKRVINS